jgi:hypothetical protein
MEWKRYDSSLFSNHNNKIFPVLFNFIQPQYQFLCCPWLKGLNGDNKEPKLKIEKRDKCPKYTDESIKLLSSAFSCVHQFIMSSKILCPFLLLIYTCLSIQCRHAGVTYLYNVDMLEWLIYTMLTCWSDLSIQCWHAGVTSLYNVNMLEWQVYTMLTCWSDKSTYGLLLLWNNTINIQLSWLV